MSALDPCPFCGCEAKLKEYKPTVSGVAICTGCGARSPICRGDHTGGWKKHAAEAWNRRAERTWHNFSDELPPAGASILCMGKSGALYVGKLVTIGGDRTRRVWVPRGDQYRTPEKWMVVDE